MNVKRVVGLFIVLTVALIVNACSSGANQASEASTSVTNDAADEANANANTEEEAYPTEPIRFIVAYNEGGSVDTAARQIAPEVELALDTNIVVENRGGAGGVVASNYVSGLNPDGYNILIHGMPSIIVNTYLNEDEAQYELDDFKPVASWVNNDGNVLVVAKDSPYDSLDDIVEAGKTKQLSIGINGGLGSTDHITVATMRQTTGADLNMVPYDSDASAAVLGGHVDLGMISMTTQALTEENFKFIAVTTAERLDEYPDLPTFAELGYPELTMPFTVGAFVHKDTPEHVIETLEKGFETAFHSDKYQEWAENSNTPIGNFMGSDDFTEAMDIIDDAILESIPLLEADMEEAGE